MSNHPSGPTAPSSRQARGWALAVVILVVTAAVVHFLSHRGKPPVKTLVRSQLQLRDGRLHTLEGGQPFTGLMIETNADGGLLSRSTMSKGWLEGVSEGFHTNGQLQVLEHFHENVSHGPRTKWHPNGVKASEGQVVSGKLEGWFVRWNEDGSLAEEISMKGGQPDGPSRSYYPSGCVRAQVTLQSGRVIEQKFFADGEQRAPFLTTNTSASATPASKP